MGTLKRKENWASALERVIDAARHAPFNRGRHDCALFVADALLAMTGTDTAAGLRGKYKDAKGAARALKKRGWGTLAGAAETFFGAPVARFYAGRGDVAEVETPEGPALGVIDNTGRRAAVVGEQGLVFVPLEKILRVWKV